MRYLKIIVPLLWVVLLTDAGPAAVDRPVQDIELHPVLAGLSAPNGVYNAGDGTDRLFVVEQGGKILVTDRTRASAKVFLDLSSLVSVGAERGLLGLAFHPAFKTNGRLFVDYTDSDGNTVVDEYHAANAADRADPSPVQRVLYVKQPQEYHNGGSLAFGPDGYFYIGMGDGGWPEDQIGTGPDTSRLFGVVLRIDVDRGRPYAIPPGNPFAHGGGRPEIWLYGFRNPWRLSFDSANGDLWIADVGQVTWEEVDVFRSGEAPGVDYGWSIVEGPACFQGSCDLSRFREPVAYYGGRKLKTGNCAVIGGYVYRGAAVPGLDGWYVYSDFCSGRVWTVLAADPSDGPLLRLDTDLTPTAFGVDESNELYLVDYGSGTLYQFVPAT
jgi:glucose/arabinose dehydrogenase